MKYLAPLIILMVFLLPACSPVEQSASPTLVASATHYLTPSISPTPSPLAPTATATPLIIEGTLTIKVNVRSGPGTANSSLGMLDAGQKVSIFSRTNDGTWYRVLYPPSPQGYGWIASAYVTIPTGTQVPLDATPTPAGPTGEVVQRLNVRSGPGTNFNTLGMIEPNQVVFLTGKNSTASWFQIEYPSGPDGHGWVTAQYIRTDSASSLPVLDDYGKVVTPGATAVDTGPAFTPTPTVGPAYNDGDSSANPGVRVVFSPTGTSQIVYSSQVSSPQGDAEDWIEFTPYSLSSSDASLLISLTCSGNSTLSVDLWQAGASFTGWGSLSCGASDRRISLPAGQAYEIRITPVEGTGLTLVSYTLMVVNEP